MPATKFVPEVPHAQLRFENLRIRESDILPGDGYDQYVKPFRTVEDIHVQAAVLSYLMREGQRLSWPQGWLEASAPNSWGPVPLEAWAIAGVGYIALVALVRGAANAKQLLAFSKPALAANVAGNRTCR